MAVKLASLLLAIAALSRCASSAQGLDSWTNQHLQEFMDATVPFLRPSAKQAGASWLVSGRRVPVFDEPLSSFVIYVGYDGLVRAEVVAAEKPLGKQLQALHSAAPDTAIASLAVKARVRHTSLNSNSCRILRTLVEDLTALRISPLPQNFLTVDAVSYSLYVSSAYGDSRTYTVLEPPGTYWGDLGQYPDPLIEWFKRVQAAVVRCANGTA